MNLVEWLIVASTRRLIHDTPIRWRDDAFRMARRLVRAYRAPERIGVAKP